MLSPPIRSTTRKRNREAFVTEMKRRRGRFWTASSMLKGYTEVDFKHGFLRIGSCHGKPATHIAIREVFVNTYARGAGLGTKMVRLLCAAADACGFTLRVYVKPFGLHNRGPDRETLMDWYARFGFEPTGNGPRMVRRPVRKTRVFSRRAA